MHQTLQIRVHCYDCNPYDVAEEAARTSAGEGLLGWSRAETAQSWTVALNLLECFELQLGLCAPKNNIQHFFRYFYNFVLIWLKIHNL